MTFIEFLKDQTFDYAAHNFGFKGKRINSFEDEKRRSIQVDILNLDNNKEIFPIFFKLDYEEIDSTFFSDVEPHSWTFPYSSDKIYDGYHLISYIRYPDESDLRAFHEKYIKSDKNYDVILAGIKKHFIECFDELYGDNWPANLTRKLNKYGCLYYRFTVAPKHWPFDENHGRILVEELKKGKYHFSFMPSL